MFERFDQNPMTAAGTRWYPKTAWHTHTHITLLTDLKSVHTFYLQSKYMWKTGAWLLVDNLCVDAKPHLPRVVCIAFLFFVVNIEEEISDMDMCETLRKHLTDKQSSHWLYNMIGCCFSLNRQNSGQRLCNETCHYKMASWRKKRWYYLFIYHLFTHILLIMQSVYDLRQMLSFKTF